MKRNKKGFTIVELVIVIAVIAILAAVLIPTFSSVIDNANKSSALQEGKAALDVVAMMETQKGETMNGSIWYFVNTDKANASKDGYVCAYDASAAEPFSVVKYSTVSSKLTDKKYDSSTNADLGKVEVYKAAK